MTGPAPERTTAPGEAASGSIYDLGYRHYEGARLGRPAAILALYADSLRACFGLGRPARAKVVPVGLLLLALLPAVVAVAVEALAGGAIPNPIRYDNYFSTIVQFLVLFVAAQAPELVGRDQRYQVLSLYFSRALDRLDYPAAKLGALVSALLVVSLLPQAAIFVGKVLGGRDPVAAFGANVDQVVPILVSAAAAALVMAALALAVAAFTPRRAYATAGIFALFFISLGVAAVVAQSVHGTLSDLAPLLSPTATLEGLTAWLFDSVPSGEGFGTFALPGPVYGLAALVLAGAASAVLAWRYRRIAA